MRRHRKACWQLLIMIVVLLAAVAASRVPAQPDERSATLPVRLYQETNAKLVYSPAWKTVKNSRCFGGSMRRRNAAGSVTAAFSGTAVSVYATKGRAYGIMKVTIDGVVRRRVSLYASAAAYRQKVFTKTGMANRVHMLKLAWTGAKNAAASAKTVNLDALRIQGKLVQVVTPTPTPTPTVTPTTPPGTTYQETDSRLRYFGVWTSESSANFSGGTQRTVGIPGAVLIDFTGTQAYVLASKGPGYGTMNVTLDGAAQPNVNLSAATAKYQQVVFSKTGLTDAAHRLVIEGAAGKINLDAITVLGTLTQAPDFAGGLVGFWAMTPEYNWAESWRFRTDGTYNYFVTNGGTWYNEEGLYAAYQGANSKLVLLFDRRNQDGPEQPWGSLSDMECPYWITYYSNGTLLKINGPNLDVNYWLQP